jgi:hypothetical protein
MRNKVVGVTKPIYELCKVLEEFEDEINFSVFYPFSRILESHLFCPGFYFDGVYYEIQYDDYDNLKLVDFGVREWKEVGDELSLEEIVKLTENIKEYYKI